MELAVDPFWEPRATKISSLGSVGWNLQEFDVGGGK
jgi:hypothetical protein